MGTNVAKGAKKVLWNFVQISLGSSLCALAINGILIPKGFYRAGFTGIALLVHYIAPALPVLLIYLVLNIPVFGIGWIYVGRCFFYYKILPARLFLQRPWNGFTCPFPLTTRF